MYIPHGFWVNELGDIDVIAHDGLIHLYHLVLPNHDQVGHAVSADGLTWTPAKTALRTGDPGAGECDDDMIWTMHTIRHPSGRTSGGAFVMYYTACALAERGQCQRVAMATSDDLVNWTKHPGNPVLAAAAPYYNDRLDMVGFVSFRDPFVFVEEGAWHMFVSARTANGPRFMRGCVAHGTSVDGVEWKLVEPLYAPGQFEDAEVPAVLKIEGTYYLFFHDFSGNSLYRRSESLAGPWEAPRRDMLLPPMNCVFRFCQWRGATLLYHWIRAEGDWKGRTQAEAVALAPPKEVVRLGNGELALKSFGGWSALYGGAAATWDAADVVRQQATPEGAWRVDGVEAVAGGGPAGSLLGGGGVRGRAMAFHNVELDNFILEVDLTLEAGRSIGLFFRADKELERANLLRLNVFRGCVELYKLIGYESSPFRFKQKRVLVQSAPFSITHRKTVRVRVVACRAYVEVSLDGIVYLSALTYAAQAGRVGLLVEDGVGRFGKLQVQRLKDPGADWEWKRILIFKSL